MLTELEIGNPPGYNGAYAPRVGAISVGDGCHAVDPGADRAEARDDRRRALPLRSHRTTPTSVRCRRMLPASNGSSTVKLIIDKLDMTNTQASVSSPLLSRARWK